MNKGTVRLSWSDFVIELSELTLTIPNVPPLYLVGGAVRNAYMGGAIDEIDVAVDGDAIAVARFVTDAWNADIYIMDRERKVARVFVKRGGGVTTIDFASFRGDTLVDDLRDRDFTMNAMAADLLGDPLALIDPLNGVTDLRTKVLRRCSPQSIANDPIRVLRAVRLSVQFDLKIHPDTVIDIRRHADDLSHSSPERVRDEFFKLLGIQKAARGLRVLARIGALEPVLPLGAAAGNFSLAVAERMSTILTAISSKRTDNTAAAFDLGILVIQLDRFRASFQEHLSRVYGNGRTHEELLMLAALVQHMSESYSREDLSSVAANVTNLVRSLRLTREEERRMAAAIGNCREILGRKSWTPLDQHRFWYRLNLSGIDSVLLGAAIQMAAQGTTLKQDEWLQFVERAIGLLDVYFNRYDEIVSPTILLDGNDVQTLLNVGSGPLVGRVLTSLREAQVKGEIKSVAEARSFVLCASGWDVE